MKLLILGIIYCCCHGIEAKLDMDLFLGHYRPIVKPETSDKEYPEYWMSQKLDHNNSQSPDWNQRYFIKDEFFKDTKGPIFIRVEGEFPADNSWLDTGMWYQWAKRYGAYMIVLEHRYFGKSIPTADTSPENLIYLRSQQAIADIAHFIEQMSADKGWQSNKWILFGGSYPGNIATWARLKYPNLVYASVSSSAPVQAKADFPEYYEGTRQALNNFSQGCGDEVAKAALSIQDSLQTDAGYQEVSQKIPICPGFTPGKANDIATMFSLLGTFIVSSVQYNGIDEPGMETVCKHMSDESLAGPVERLAKLYKDFNKHCLMGSYDTLVSIEKDTSWTTHLATSGGKLWLFLVCNELGFLQTSESKSSLFSDTLPYEYRIQFCSDVFGSSFTREKIEQSVDYTNQYYGGTDIQVERIVFVQGSIDPWHVLGMIKNPTKDDPLLIVEGGSHCQDMNSPDKSDPPTMPEIRNTVQTYLDTWLDFKSAK